jgi:hypothetical protein
MKNTNPSAQPSARASVQKRGSKLVLTIEGNWNVRHVRNQQIDNAISNLDRQGSADTLEFQTAGLPAWDTSLLILALRVEAWCRQHRVRLAQRSLPSGVRGLLALVGRLPARHPMRQRRGRRG